MRWLDGITDLMDMNLSRLQELAMDRAAWRAAIHRVTKRWTRLSNSTELKCTTDPPSSGPGMRVLGRSSSPFLIMRQLNKMIGGVNGETNNKVAWFGEWVGQP